MTVQKDEKGQEKYADSAPASVEQKLAITLEIWSLARTTTTRRGVLESGSANHSWKFNINNGGINNKGGIRCHATMRAT
jgi:hypothetical protein